MIVFTARRVCALCRGKLFVRLSVLHTPVFCVKGYTIHISSKFLPRDATHKRGLRHHAVSVCVCACLSVCHVRELCENE